MCNGRYNSYFEAAPCESSQGAVLDVAYSMIFHEAYAFVSDSQTDIPVYGKEYQFETRCGVISVFASKFCEFMIRR